MNRPLMDDKEVAFLNLYEDPPNIEAFKEGWRARRDDPEGDPNVQAKERGIYPEDQTLRISWDRGYYACHILHSSLTSNEFLPDL